MHASQIAAELNLQSKQVTATINLLDEGGTVPFIARYRKEVTGTLDEVAIAAIRDRLSQLRELDKRREAILKSLKEQEKLTPALEGQVKKAATLSELEDIYLPYKPTRKTRASMAREKGLEPLATQLWEQGAEDPETLAKGFIDAEKEVNSEEEALQGARDIMAEMINESAEARSRMRRLFERQSALKSRVFPGKEAEAQKYRDYFEWEEPVSKAPSHRVLAMRRGESEMMLMLDMYPPEEEAQLSHVAFSLEAAIEALDADREFLKAGDVFSDDLIDGYIALKTEEIQRLRMATHPVEFDMYYSL